MFIWDFVANPIMDALMDWFYSQVVGFLGAFFAQMGNMGAELFELEWVQAVVLFFSQLGWALYGVSLVVSGFECGIEYISGRGNIQQAALNAIKGFLAVNLFTVVPVRLYSLSVALQGTFAQGITGAGSGIFGKHGVYFLNGDRGCWPLGNWHQPTHADLLHNFDGLCCDQGVFRKSKKGRHSSHPDRGWKPLYVFNP